MAEAIRPGHWPNQDWMSLRSIGRQGNYQVLAFKSWMARKTSLRLI